MPLDKGLGSIVAAEWERFSDGLAQLHPAARAAAREQARFKIEQQKGTASITIPGWDDVIHLQPRVEVTPEQARRHFAALREGKPSPLTTDEVAELDRRVARRRALITSAQPDYAQAFGQILTAIDNVQDLLSTIAVVGRILSWPTLKLFGRAIPGVGTIILLADLLNLLGFLGGLALPGYELYCKGHVTMGGVPALAGAWGRALKLKAEGAAALNPFGRAARMKRQLKVARALPSVGNLLEVAQVTDQLFGVGVSFGGLYGAWMEGLYATERALTGERVEWNQVGNLLGGVGAAVMLAGGARHSARLAGVGAAAIAVDQLRRHNTAQLEAKQKAAATLKQLPITTNVQDVLTDEEHVGALVAAIAAVDLLAEDTNPAGVDDLLAQLVDARLTVTPPADGVTLELLDQVRDGRASAYRWPFPGAPVELPVRDYVETTVRRTPAALRDFLDQRRGTVIGAFAGALVNTLNERLWLLITGDDHALKYSLTPPYAVTAGLSNANRVVNVAGDEASTARFLTELLARVEDDGRAFLDPAEYDAIAARHGVELIRLAAPR